MRHCEVRINSRTLRLLLWTLIKGYRNYLALHRLVPYFDRYFSIDCRKIAWHVGQRNVLLEERAVRPAGHVPDFFSAQIQNLIAVSGNAAFDRFQPHERPLDPGRL